MRDEDRVINEAWHRPTRRRDILDRMGMSKYRMPAPENVADVFEGRIVGSLLTVFRQLDKIGARRAKG
jgi:hypothetical protein